MVTTINENAMWARGAKRTSGPYTGGPPKGILHATIAPSNIMPDYAGQANAPHCTLLWYASTKTLVPYMHYRYDNFAKSLKNLPGGVETNRDTALQWELAGYLGANHAEVPFGQFDILKAPSVYWEQVADVIGPVLRSWNVKPVSLFNQPRLSLAQWDNGSFLATHAQVPENDHWDLPFSTAMGTLLVNRIWSGATTTPPTPAPIPVHAKAPTFPLPAGHYFGVYNRTDARCHSGTYSAVDRGYIRTWQKQMLMRNWNITVDGVFGKQCESICVKFGAEKHVPGDDHYLGPNLWRASWEAPKTP